MIQQFHLCYIPKRIYKLWYQKLGIRLLWNEAGLEGPGTWMCFAVGLQHGAQPGEVGNGHLTGQLEQ